MNNIIKLELTIEETNGVLAALGQMPFNQVQALIAKIQQQASGQLQEDGAVSTGEDGAGEEK